MSWLNVWRIKENIIMPQHENKKCPRCSGSFECKTGSILLCQCSTVAMTAEQLEYSSKEYDDCLCRNCLKELRAEYNTLSFSQNMQSLLSGRGNIKK